MFSVCVLLAHSPTETIFLFPTSNCRRTGRRRIMPTPPFSNPSERRAEATQLFLHFNFLLLMLLFALLIAIESIESCYFLRLLSYYNFLLSTIFSAVSEDTRKQAARRSPSGQVVTNLTISPRQPTINNSARQPYHTRVPRPFPYFEKKTQIEVKRFFFKRRKTTAELLWSYSFAPASSYCSIRFVPKVFRHQKLLSLANVCESGNGEITLTGRRVLQQLRPVERPMSSTWRRRLRISRFQTRINWARNDIDAVDRLLFSSSA